MARNLALWSMTLLPGDKYPLYIQNDFTITNAALPEDLADANGRSVVKVTYHPINPALLADADDSDSEIDSEDFDDEDLEGLEDEFELDEDEGFKEVAKKAKVNGATEEEDDGEGEEEEDEDEDEDEDDDFSDDEPEVTNVICALTAGRTEQAQVNLTFTEGDAVMFEVTGKNAVHLMGNYIRQPEPHSHSDDEDSDSEFDSDEDDYDMYSDLEDEEDNEEEAPVGKITEIIEKPVAAAKKAVAAAAAAVAPASAPAPVQTEKKRKAEQVESPAKAGTGAETLSKKQKKLAAAAEANEAAKKDVKEKKEKEVKKAAEPSKKRTLPSGLVIEDIKSGDGPGAKRGKRLGMRYIGKLTNGKQFDANTSGKPFSFVLGRGEVIKGWDEGLEGMKVGGERKLSIPPQLAYGNQKLPGIPKGSTLNFEVKLVSIN